MKKLPDGTRRAVLPGEDQLPWSLHRQFKSKVKQFNPFPPTFKKDVLPTFRQEIFKSRVHLSLKWWLKSFWLKSSFRRSKVWKAKFFILCGVIFSGETAGEIWDWSLVGMRYPFYHSILCVCFSQRTWVFLFVNLRLSVSLSQFWGKRQKQSTFASAK